jgi:hypothetical protein
MHNIIKPICFYKNYNRFWFELINQEKFEMKLLKNGPPHIYFIFHLKVIDCQDFNLPQCTYGHHLEKHPFVI